MHRVSALLGLVGFLLLVVAGCAGSDSAAGDVATASPAAESAVEPTPVPSVQSEAAAPEPTAVPPSDQSDTEPAPPTAPTASPVVAEREPVVYDDDFGTSIAPIFADHCASCHNAGGPGAPHWQLEDAADLVATHEWITSITGSGYMPPWPASKLSPLFHEDRSLAADEIEAIAAWSAQGAPLDVEPTTPIVATVPTISLDVDVEIEPHEPYVGSTAVADDYRCLIYELGLTEPTFMQGYEFVPDQTQIVHHAVGFLVPASEMDLAQRLNAQDDIGGWQCFGASGLRDESLFVGWAPGQLPTIYPEGSGLLAQPGDFVVLQIHYHLDTEAPEDRSTLRVDWAEGELNAIEFGQYLAPAEIPCSADETGPLCDRDAARARALDLYGFEGVLADRINSVCGVRPADFESMTDGIATSSCVLPVLQSGEIVSVFGHQHEIGKSVRMTLNAGRADERILLDIPDWSFDWQLNYEPIESILLGPGDTILLECAWDRDRRDPDLEPAWVLWADGTNDEMCFATITTLPADGDAEVTVPDSLFGLPAELADCMTEAGVTAVAPAREGIDAAVDALFECATPEEVGELLSGLIAENFGGLLGENDITCLSESMATPDGARELFVYSLPDATRVERLPFAEIVGDCVSVADAITNFSFPIPEDAKQCVDEQGRSLLVTSMLLAELPDEIQLFGLVNSCINDS